MSELGISVSVVGVLLSAVILFLMLRSMSKLKLTLQFPVKGKMCPRTFLLSFLNRGAHVLKVKQLIFENESGQKLMCEANSLGELMGESLTPGSRLNHKVAARHVLHAAALAHPQHIEGLSNVDKVRVYVVDQRGYTTVSNWVECSLLDDCSTPKSCSDNCWNKGDKR